MTRRPGGPIYQRSVRWRAARASSRRRTGVVRGASSSSSGSPSASRAAWRSASANASRVSRVSVSVVSTIKASSTTSVKYTVEGWKPRSITRLATSVARTWVRSRSGRAVATNSCIGRCRVGRERPGPLAPPDDGYGEKRDEPLGDPDRPRPRPSPTVGGGEGLVGVDVDDVEPHVARPAPAEDRVEVRPVVVHESADPMDHLGDRLDVLLEQT